MLIEYNYEDTHIFGIYSSREEAIIAKRELGTQRWKYVYSKEWKTDRAYPYQELVNIVPEDAVTIVEFTLDETKEKANGG